MQKPPLRSGFFTLLAVLNVYCLSEAASQMMSNPTTHKGFLRYRNNEYLHYCGNILLL